MKEVLEFLKLKNLEKTQVFLQLKCSLIEAKILKFMTKEYILGTDNLLVLDILKEFYDIEKFEHLDALKTIKNLLELGWVSQSTFSHVKLGEMSKIELLSCSLTLSSSFFKLLEDGSLDFALPEVSKYSDHLEYLQDQFFKIDLAQKLNNTKHNFEKNSPNISRLKTKLVSLENRIKEKILVTDKEIILESFFKEHALNEKERTIFLALLKEEYSGGNGSIRDMGALIDLISTDDYEKIKHRSLLEESSTLVSNALVDYDEMLNPFGGINRNFYIPDDVLYKISHPSKKKSKNPKIKMQSLIKEQNIFELIDTNKTLDEVVLNPKTKDTLNALLKQVDKNVSARLKAWGIKDKKGGLEAKIIFYGLAGTGKTLTALALAKALKRQILSFDCSKILSMYVGQSEKNVRSIFDTYKDIVSKSKSEPILLLNEADQFLSSRISSSQGGSDKMHNQMQNIFLEQIERFDGILIATTNLLENIDKAFSRRFNYKIEFTKPNFEERLRLWEILLPKKIPLEKELDLKELSTFGLSGGQIELVIKNTAYKIAANDKPIFCTKDFIEEIKKEQKSMFDSENKVGFF